MSELVAVNNSNFEIEVTPAGLPGPTVASPNNGTATPTSPAIFGVGDCKVVKDNNCKIQGDEVLKDKITEKLPSNPTPPPLGSGGSAADFLCAPTVGTSAWSNRGAYSINSTADKSKCSGVAVMREKDSTIINCVCAGTNAASPTTAPFSGSCIIKISKAGQNIEVRSK